MTDSSSSRTQSDIPKSDKKPESWDTLFAIYDICSQPVSVGDLYTYQFGILAIAELLNIPKIDFCLLYDPSIRHCDPNFHNMLEPDQHLNRTLKMAHILELNPRVGSIHIANSNLELPRILGQLGNKNLIWPDLELITSRKYLYYTMFELLNRYWKTYGRIPTIQLKSPQRNWVSTFFDKHSSSSIPVTINIRNNQHIDQNRNSDILTWSKFFKYCESRYPIKFIILCDTHEIVAEWRNYSNVVFSKDSLSSVDIDYALALSSAFHFGTASGLAIGHLTTQPFLMTNVTLIECIPLYNGILAQDASGILRFTFNHSLQKMTPLKETFEMLVEALDSIMTSSDWMRWKSPAHLSS